MLMSCCTPRKCEPSMLVQSTNTRSTGVHSGFFFIIYHDGKMVINFLFVIYTYRTPGTVEHLFKLLLKVQH